MNKKLHVKPYEEGFIMYFQSATIIVCMKEMVALLRDICAEDRHIFELGLFQYLQVEGHKFECLMRYQIYVGRMSFFVCQKELVHLLAEMWAQNQSLMNFIYMESFKKEEISYQPSPKTLHTEAIG